MLKYLPEEIRPVAKFAYITGWRVKSEVLTREWRHVDLKAGEIRLEPGTTKNREGRTFPFTSELRTLVEAQHAEHEGARYVEAKKPLQARYRRAAPKFIAT